MPTKSLTTAKDDPFVNIEASSSAESGKSLNNIMIRGHHRESRENVSPSHGSLISMPKFYTSDFDGSAKELRTISSQSGGASRFKDGGDITPTLHHSFPTWYFMQNDLLQIMLQASTCNNWFS